MKALRWAAGILIGFGLLIGGYLAGFTIYALTHTATGPELPQEERAHLVQPGEPGFAEHLAQGCPGDPSWSPCAMRLPDPIHTDRCRPAGGTFICTEEK